MTRYRTNECIHDGGWYQLYRAQNLQDGSDVVLKYLTNAHPSQPMTDGFRLEYRLLQQLDISTVIKALALEEHGRRLVMVREYFPGLTLKDYTAGRLLPLQQIGMLMSVLVETIDAIHKHAVVHGNINNDNILINPESLQLKLIGFGFAQSIKQPTFENSQPILSVRSLDYLAPEQSGRLNRAVDGRADIYALGVIFFNVLTGQMPFASHDSIGLMHRHIAQTIPDPREFRPQIPEMVSRIVIKMLAKDPNERYVTAADLLFEMRMCQHMLMTGGVADIVGAFKNTLPTGLRISERLYGREQAVEQLTAAFASAHQNQAVLCLVAGRSGIGKSCLIDAFGKQVLAGDGRFITAKCDQYHANPPMQIFHSAFRDLLRQLLGESDETLAYWRKRLTASLGRYAQAIIEIIPELEILMGPQPDLPELPAGETKNRLKRVWGQFVQAFCQPEQPLCLFLDDLQWADRALFDWLETMLFDVKHLLLIGSYRDNEIAVDGGLTHMADKFRLDGGRVESIELTALPVSAFAELIADSVKLDETAVAELCAALYDKTQGNPFFFVQTLRELQHDGILRYDALSSRWHCDSDKIRAIGISDNVVDFMLTRIGSLAEPVLELLKLAACIGTHFDVELIAAMNGPGAAQENLDTAEALGLLIKHSGQNPRHETLYDFSHDRVQQAAHTLSTEADRQSYQLKIGRYWIEKGRASNDRQLLLQGVEHLNAALALIVDADEKRRLGVDNFKLGLWAKHSGAFEQALPYLRNACDILSEDLQRFGGFAAMLRHRAECEHLCGYHQQAQDFFERAVIYAESDLEKARIYELMIQFYADLAQFDKAYSISREAAALFGIDLPAGFNRLAFMADFLRLKYRLRKFDVDDLLVLPSVTEARMDIVIRLLSATMKVAYQLRPELCVAISVKQIGRCLNYGNNAEAVIGYMVFGVIFLGGVLGNHQAGYDYGRLALGLLERYANQRQKAEVNFVYGYFAHSWSYPAADTETYWRTAIESGLEAGDWFHTGCACSGLSQSLFMRGVALDDIWSETDKMLVTLKRIDSREHLGAIQGIRQAIQNLRGNTDAIDAFGDEHFDEAAFVGLLADYGSRHFAHYYYVNKMQCLYLWGKYEEAFALSRISAEYLKDSAGMLHAVEHHFYTALILAKRYQGLPRFERYKALQAMRQTEKNLRRWARRCPQSFLSRCYLLDGEIQRLRQRPEAALQAYHKAAVEAEASGQLHLEALANELAARLHAELSQERLARFHFEEACYCYQRWGASGYLRQFSIAVGQGKVMPLRYEGAAKQSYDGDAILDTVTLIKAAETIAAEKRLPKLLKTLMHIVIENAGAQRGVLLLREDDGLVVQAKVEIDAGAFAVLQRQPLSEAYGIAQSVINYVSRTLETVVLDNAAQSPLYGRDKDIAERRVRSLLCAPLLLRGEIQGILYLENNVADAVFTRERVFLLQHLSGQIAISIDNALGYQMLEDKVAERTRHIEIQKSDLEEKNSKLEASNSTILALNERLQTENWERRLAEQELQKANTELQRLATIDGLTQIANRRRFDACLENECQRLLRDNTPLALLLCDIDYFKNFNDLYGHQAGDDCLKKVGQAIAGALRRPTDLAARYGGEEFAVIMPHTDLNGAVQVAEAIQQAIFDLRIRHDGSQVADAITLSIGIATAMPFRKCSPVALIKVADQALYRVKEHGRNGIEQREVA